MRIGTIVAGGAALLITGCLAHAGTSTDYDVNTDFSKYKTYSWGKGTPAPNSLANDRIINAVDAQLQAKGWKKVGDSQGDAVVATHVAVEDRVSLDTFYTGWDAGWGWYGGGAHTATTTVTNYRQGMLLVDIFDAEKKALIWRGQADRTLPTNPSPEKSEKRINEVVQKLFRSFPPERKKQ